MQSIPLNLVTLFVYALKNECGSYSIALSMCLSCVSELCVCTELKTQWPCNLLAEACGGDKQRAVNQNSDSELCHHHLQVLINCLSSPFMLQLQAFLFLHLLNMTALLTYQSPRKAARLTYSLHHTPRGKAPALCWALSSLFILIDFLLPEFNQITGKHGCKDNN